MSRRTTPVLLAFAVLAACRPAPRPSVLVISVDSLRADEVDAVVGGRPVAPAMAAFARESVRFTAAQAPAPWTSPSMMSVMTGLSPLAHGVEEHDRALAAGVATLAERFRAAGYRTAAVIPAMTLRGEYGFSRGFDTFDYFPFDHDTITAPQLTGKLLHQLDRVAEDDFFLWLHHWDPHYNYIPEPPYDAAYDAGTRPRRTDVQCLKWIENPLAPEEASWLRGRFRGEVAFTDRHIKDVLDHLARLGRADDTVVVILGDHGEAFQEHGWLGHTVRVDQEMVHVPLMIRWPKKLAAARIDAPVSLAQIGRTLLRLAGLPDERFGAERPLPLSPDEVAAAPPEPPLSQTMRMGCATALVDGTAKYVIDHRTCAESLFDLRADPAEMRNLAPLDPDRLAGPRRLLRERLAALRALGVPKAALPADIVNEAEAALRSIGYVAPGPGGGGDVVCEAIPDPTKYRRDALGDISVFKPCPEEGAARCLERLP